MPGLAASLVGPQLENEATSHFVTSKNPEKTKRGTSSANIRTHQSATTMIQKMSWLWSAASVLFLYAVAVSSFVASSTNRDLGYSRRLSGLGATESEVEVIVVGAGVGGLSCAALSARYGLDTLCVEAHDTPGGCAHSFARFSSASKTVPFRFDSGPSLVSGLSQMSTNPLRQVLDAIGTADAIDWCTYDGWVVHDNADGKAFRVTTGNGGQWEQALQDKAGLESRRAFEAFRDKMLGPKSLSDVSAYIPPFALRGGIAAVASLAQYFFKLLSIGSKGTLLTGPFTKCMDLYEVREEKEKTTSQRHGVFPCLC